MKYISILLFIFIVAGTASAGPFMVCDPQETVTSYKITGDITETVNAEPDTTIKYDLAGIAEQSYTVGVSACNEWGCSTPAPLLFTKQLPQSPINMRLEP